MYIQNFGYLLQPMVMGGVSYKLYHNEPKIKDEIIPIRTNKLYVTNQYKICLSIPYTIQVHNESPGFIARTTTYNYHYSKKLRKQIDASLQPLFRIYYTGDSWPWVRHPKDRKDYIVKTNRYSKFELDLTSYPPLKSFLFEYDDIDPKDVSFIEKQFFS